MDEDLTKHVDELPAIVAAIHQATAVIAVLSFAGYGAAAWLVFRGLIWPALGMATFSYLFFRLYPSLSVLWARWRFSDDAAAAAALGALEHAWAGRSPRSVLVEVDAWLRERGSQHH